MKPIRFPRHQSGFSLLEVLLAVGVAIAVGSMQLTKIKNDTERAQAQAVGRQLKLVGEALNRYIMFQRNSLINGISVVGEGTVGDPGPRTCTSITTAQGPGWQCTVTTQTLQRTGVLPMSFSGVNAYGSPYEYVIRVEGTAPDWRVEGIVRTAQPYTSGGRVRQDLIGQALATAGSEAGSVVDASGTINGLNGMWVDSNWAFGTPQEGMMAYRAGFGTGGFTELLRVDGTTEFTHDLDMGHTASGLGSLREVADVAARRDIRAGSFQTETRADAITLGADDPINQTVLGNDGNRLQIRNQGGVQFLDGSGNPTEMLAGDLTVGSVTSRGNGSFVGNVQSHGMSTVGEDGHIVTTGDVSADGDFFTENVLGGGFITKLGHFNTTNGNLYTEHGTVRAQDLVIGGSAAIGMRDTGPGAKSRLNFGTTGRAWFYYQDSNTMTLENVPILDIGGQLLAGSLRTTEQLEGSRLQIGAQQAPGTSCNSNTFAVDSSGRMMECLDGVYTILGWAKNTTQTISGLIAYTGQQASAQCPPGYRVVGGGWRVTQRNTPATDPYSPSKSYADVAGNRWIVENIGNGNTAGFEAQAICAK